MAPSLDLTTSSPPARIPKLKYRNPLPADQQSPSSPESRRDSQQQQQRPPATPLSHASSSYIRPSFDSASLTPPSLASTASSASSNDSKSSKQKKKKTGSVLSFLSLKEPSQIAFEQYAEAQRKQALEKGTSSPLSRPPSSYATKKLPKNVPKVNSKWDGVPDSVKNRYPKSSGSNSNRHSVRTQGSQDSQDSRLTTRSWNDSRASVMSHGSRNPPNSIASAAQSVSDLSIRDEARAASPLPSTRPLPELSYYFPQPLASGALQVESSPQAYYPAIVDALQPSDSPPDFDSQMDKFSGLRADSPASSTDSVDTVVRDTADVLFKKLNDQPQKSFWGDASPVQPLDKANETPVPESHDFLFDIPSPLEAEAEDDDYSDDDSACAPPSIPFYAPTRSVHNFSRPMSTKSVTSPPRSVSMPSYRTTPIDSGLPTLYEASLASNDADDTVQDDEDDDAYSIAPSTFAPSVMSARWHDSPRERLGLGGRLRMNDISPWEGRMDQPGKPKKNRLSLFGKVTTKA